MASRGSDGISGGTAGTSRSQRFPPSSTVLLAASLATGTLINTMNQNFSWFFGLQTEIGYTLNESGTARRRIAGPNSYWLAKWMTVGTAHAPSITLGIGSIK
jgi:hypothetical protein